MSRTLAVYSRLSLHHPPCCPQNLASCFAHSDLTLAREKVKSLSRVRFFATPWTVAHQAPPSMGFSRQEHWSGMPFPSPGDLPNPGIKPRSPSLQADALTSEPPGRPLGKRERKDFFPKSSHLKQALEGSRRLHMDFCFPSRPSLATAHLVSRGWSL